MIPVIISLGNPDPDVAPSTFGEAINEIRPLLAGEIQETLSAFVMGVEVPAVDDQDKPWFRITTLGAPAGWYKYHFGVWVREQPTPGSQIGYFTGDPTIYFDGEGRGLKGAGPVAGDYWGWQLMNGLHGTPNLSDKFIILGRMDNEDITGFSGGWRTNINGVPESEGGQSEILLDADNTYRPAGDAVSLGRWTATSGQSSQPAGVLWGSTVGSEVNTVELIPEDEGNTEPLAVNIVNPFFAMAMIQFVGYGSEL